MCANVRKRSRICVNLDTSIKDIAGHHEKNSRWTGNNNVCANLLSGPTTKR